MNGPTDPTVLSAEALSALERRAEAADPNSPVATAREVLELVEHIRHLDGELVTLALTGTTSNTRR
jgi:hypothetical protein